MKDTNSAVAKGISMKIVSEISPYKMSSMF